MKTTKKQLEEVVRKIVLESLKEMDLGKRQTNLPQSTAGTVPRPKKGAGKIAALNRTIKDMPRKEELDLDTGAILEDALDEDMELTADVALEKEI